MKTLQELLGTVNSPEEMAAVLSQIGALKQKFTSELKQKAPQLLEKKKASPRVSENAASTVGTVDAVKKAFNKHLEDAKKVLAEPTTDFTGKVVRLIDNDKTVYAKVRGMMFDVKSLKWFVRFEKNSNGLILKRSNVVFEAVASEIAEFEKAQKAPEPAKASEPAKAAPSPARL